MEVGACPKLPYEEIEKKLVCLPDEPKDFDLFLSKFTFLDKIQWTEELVAEKVKYVCDDMNKEQISGCFMDFSVSKYRHIGWDLKTALGFILDRLDEYSDIPIIPILSIKYESPYEAQAKIARAVEDQNLCDRIAGIDFVGDTKKFDPSVQKRICNMWGGKLVRMHVGETDDAAHIVAAIDECGVTNVAHGIKAAYHPHILEVGRDSGVIFDIAPSGNYITGAVPVGEPHPSLAMYKAGLSMTVGSDDPVTFRTNLLYEYELLEQSGFDDSALDYLADNSRAQLMNWINYSVGRKPSFL